MNHSAEVLVLTGDVAAAQELSSYVREAGHRVLAVVSSIFDALRAVEALPRNQRRALVLLALDHVRTAADTVSLSTLARALDMRVVHVARRAEDLASQDDAGGQNSDHIACLLHPRELSLAIRLALCRPAGVHGPAATDTGWGAEGAGMAAALPAPAPWRQLLLSTPMIFYSSQARGHGRITFASENVGKLLGRGPHEVMAETRFWLERVHPQDAPQLLSARARMTQGETWTGEYRLRHQDGTYRRVLDTCVLVHVQGESAPAILGAWLDITQHHNIRETLHALEMRLNLIFEDQTELICHFLPSGILTFVNDAYCRYFGKAQEELIGRSFIPLIPDDDLERLHQALAGLSADNPVSYVEHRVITPGGELRWQSWTDRAVLDDKGRIAWYQAIGRDITDRKRIEEALRASEQRFKAIIQDQTELICRSLPDGTITFVNDAYCRYFGKAPEELIGRSFLPLILDEDTALVGQAFAALTADNPVGSVEHRVITPGGELRWQSWTNRAILDDKGRIIEYQAVGRDITEYKQAEDQIRQLNADLTRRAAELEAANVELEAFSYTASHDLRAPLRAIGSFCRLLEENYTGVLDARGKDYLRRVSRATQRMDRLIHDLLNLSRVSRTAMRLEDCNLSEMAHAILRELHLSEPDRAVELALMPDIQVRADPELLRVALENLLVNAWKFTSKSSSARIELGKTTHNGRPAYFVRDNGAGFDMSLADKLFTPFQRLHAMNEFEGTGIGLATVKRIIQRHGGDLWAEAAVGMGAMFVFTLP